MNIYRSRCMYGVNVKMTKNYNEHSLFHRSTVDKSIRHNNPCINVNVDYFRKLERHAYNLNYCMILTTLL